MLIIAIMKIKTNCKEESIIQNQIMTYKYIKKQKPYFNFSKKTLS